jgi:hypothetical protein
LIRDEPPVRLERHFQRSAWQADDDLVFANSDTGKPLGRTKLTKRYREALKRAGMGHRDLKTVQIYADYSPGQKEAE